MSVPKNAGRWIASVQHHMAKAGEHRSASAVDLMIAATAAHHGLTILHDDADYRTVAARWGWVGSARGCVAALGSADADPDGRAESWRR